MSENDNEEVHKGDVKFLMKPEAQERRLDTTDHQFKLGSYAKSSTDEADEESPRILDPDHPLLEKFQRTLKEHLQKQLEHLQNEVFELETGAKKKSIAREQLGVEAYESQQLVNRQQKELEMCVAELDQVCSATEEIELELEEAKHVFSEKRAEMFEAEKKERHLRTEVEGLNLLMHQMKAWENDVESELTINQRVFEKTKKDKFKLADEKRQLDVIVYKLMTEIWRVEEELETIDMQLRVKEEEREKLGDAVAASNIDIESMNSELRCLLHSWNSIIVMVSQRDRHYNTVKKDLDMLSEKLRIMSTELEQTRKLCQKEMQQNERLTLIQTRIETDMEYCTKLMEGESRKRDILERQMNDDQMMIDQIEKDISRISAENTNKSNELARLVKEFERTSQEKVSVELDIMNLLEEQLTNNKAAKYLNKLLYQIKEKNRDLEISLADVENSNAKVLMDIEAQKCMNGETQRLLDELTQRQNAIDDEVKERAAEFDRLIFMAAKKQREIDVLTNKIETVINRQGGSEMSPEEVKILTLEKGIEDARIKRKQLQTFWLRQQGYVVSLSEQRQDQINDMNLLKKQMLLLVQKNLKINDELDGHKKIEETMARLINNLQNRLAVLNDELCKKKGNKDDLCKDNDVVQNDYLGKLQQSEMDCLKIEADITDIEEDKVNLSNELIELNREALTWEKKIQMAVETKRTMDAEKGEGGEVGNMQAEIHRMNVRLSQLKRAQDKLILDLEHCVSRRDAIITIAEAREKKEKGGSDKTRINFARKLDDMRNQVTKLENEVVMLEEKMHGLEEEERQLFHDIAICKSDIDKFVTKTEVKSQIVEEAKTLRQKNLEVLVLKQKKLKVFSELSKKRHPYIVYRTESAITMEYEKHKQTNNNLILTLENLMSDFPTHLQVLTRIHNTLKLPLIYL